MLVKPPAHIDELWGTAGGICIRRQRGRFILQRPPHNAPPSAAPPTGFDVVVDNDTPGWEILAGSWLLQDPYFDTYGPSHRTNSSLRPYPSCRWTPTIPHPGAADLFAWWPTSPISTRSADYAVLHDGGISHYYMDQSLNGGQWNLLGRHDLTPGNTHITLYHWDRPVIFADAIRYLQVL